MIAFIVLFVILIVIYHLVTPPVVNKSDNRSSEGFLPPPVQVSLNKSIVAPSDLPGNLVGGPYQEVQRSDPTLYHVKGASQASFESITNIYENLKGFLAFEARETEEVSDPSVQLPMQIARADYERLKEEVGVMKRNHGIPSSISEVQLEEISSNLAYLQRKARTIDANKPTYGNIEEGFYDDNSTEKTNDDVVASEDDLIQFISKLKIEIMRLSGSNVAGSLPTEEYSKLSTTDSDSVYNPIIKMRIENLNKIKTDIEEILKELKRGGIKASQVPIYKKDIEKALPILGKLEDPLPSLIRTFNLPPVLASLLPPSLKNDDAMMNKISSLIDKYANDVVKGTSVSATFNVKYEPPSLNKNCPSSLLISGIPSKYDIEQVSNNPFFKIANTGSVTDNFALDPRFDGRKHESVAALNSEADGGFGWKERVLSIREQVKKRGYKPEDFGFLKPEAIKNTSSGFSWKGYARTMCTRLSASYEADLPELCGCPPENWNGW